MRQVATFDDERTARLFADVLCAREVETEVSRTREGRFSVWVLREADVEASRAAWAAFEAAPEAPEHAAAEGCVDRKEQKHAVEERRSRHEVIDVRRSFPGAARGPAPMTLLFAAASVLVTAVVLLGKHTDLAGRLFVGSADEVLLHRPFLHVADGEVWRLVTPIFLHMSLLHVFFNVWGLLDLGSIVEPRTGSLRFLGLVLASAVLSNVCQYVLAGSPFFGGLSGVLFSLAGYAWARGRVDPSSGVRVPQLTLVMLLLWLVLGFTGKAGPIANSTHLAALGLGAALGAISGVVSRR